MSESQSKALLVILDGFGIAEDPSVSAIDKANTPFIESLLDEHPHSTLSASGVDVGLPDGQFGNSEVGHLNIGAGRIVWQELSRINQDIQENHFAENNILTRTFRRASEKGRIHILGLFSDGGVHSHNNHLFELLKMAGEYELEQCFVHAFTDGRDTSPHGGLEYFRTFQKQAGQIGTGQLASVIGRYYAMDRDTRWDRTEKAYRLLTEGEGTSAENPEDVFTRSYENDITDEFILPHRIATVKNSRIEPDDVVICYNIRGDRMRQLSKALLGFEEVPFDPPSLALQYTTFTSYDDTFREDVEIAYPPVELKNTLGSWVSKRGLSQLRIAETEKYPHVTYFFNGGVETPVENEERILIPSPAVSTYDLKPEMSAREVTEKLCNRIAESPVDLVVVNYANADMVGHTGDMDAAIKAVEAVDQELEKLVHTAERLDYKILVIADHGNADRMIQPDGSSHTAHTTALVPVILIGEENAALHEGILADIAPTLLKMMNIPQPDEMTGQPLF